MAGGMKKNRRGATILEMAIVLPLLLILVFGVIEYSWMFLKAGQISNAAREGARYAILLDITSLEQVTTSPSPLVASLNNADISMDKVTVSSPTGVNVSVGQPVTIEILADYSQLKLIGFPLLPTPGTLRSSVTMLKEGY